jgi:hypothetical protein
MTACIASPHDRNNFLQDYMNNGIWIGTLAAANHLYNQYEPFARLVGGAWERLKPEERITRFPQKGIIRGRPEKTHHSKVGTVWVFECRPSLAAADQWTVETPERAISLLDLSGGSLEDAKRLLLETGIRLPEGYGSQYAVLFPNNIYTILRFEKKGAVSRAKLPADGRLKFRQADLAWKLKDKIAVDYLPHKGEFPVEIVAEVDWSSHTDFLGRLLERYRAALDGYLALKRDGDIPLKKLEKAIAEGRLGHGSAAELEAIVERMRAEWPETSRSLKAVEGMTQLLMETTEAKEMLAAAVESQKRALTTDLEQYARHEVEEMLKGRREELASVVCEIEIHAGQLDQIKAVLVDLTREENLRVDGLKQANAELVEIKSALQGAHGEVAELERGRDYAQEELGKISKQFDLTGQTLDKLKTTVSNFIHDLRHEVEASWTHDAGEVGIFAGRIERLLDEEGMSIIPMAPSSIPPWWIPTRAEVGLISSSELQARLAQEAENHGVSIDDLTLLNGFARAGEIVLLLGAQAELSLRAYARAVSGGEVRSHALDPSVIGLDDLWRVPGNSRATALALAWHHARVTPQEIVLVCLRDFDAAPFRMWLASLQAVLASDERPRNLLITAVASAASPIQATGEAEIAVLRHLLVPLHPRIRPDGAFAKVVLDPLLPASTRLRHESDEFVSPSSAVFKQLVQRGVRTSSVQRALRLFGIVGEAFEHEGHPAAASWAGYLNDGIASSLPTSLADGYEGLEALAIQR